jgi:hypothetical protein
MNWWYHFANWHDQQMLDAVMCMLVFIVMWLVGLTLYVVRQVRYKEYEIGLVDPAGRMWSLLLPLERTEDPNQIDDESESVGT